MKLASLFSGGKDSSFALWCVQMQGWDVVQLVTVIPESAESWMFHYPTVKWTRLQAEAIGIPQTMIETRAVKEREVDDLTAALRGLARTLGLDGLVSGGIASEYQRVRFDWICEKLGLKGFAPLWHKNPEQLLREEISSGFEFIITSCNALGLDRSWLGRKIDAMSLDDLLKLHNKYGLNVTFEGGEAETFVLKAPIFKGRSLSIVKAIPHWKGDAGYLDFEDVRLL